MLIVFKNGRELIVPKEVVEGIKNALDKTPTVDELWHLAVNADGSIAMLINVFDISFIVDEKHVKES